MSVNPRNYKISIRLSNEEHKKVKQKAETLGLELSTYLRFLAIKADVEIKRLNFDVGTKDGHRFKRRVN